MILFAIGAVIITVIHAVAAWERPRLTVIVSGFLWSLYAYYEHQVATGVLCDKDCNIRVDLVFFFPILGFAAYCAHQSYMGRPGQMKVLGTVLGVIGLLVFALVVESSSYAPLSGVLYAAALLICVYALVLKSKTKRSGSQA